MHDEERDRDDEEQQRAGHHEVGLQELWRG
jgi:hypothetical protein